MHAVTIATTYSHGYGFRSGKIGLCLGIPLLIASGLAELMTGRISDLILYMDAKRHGGVRRPEVRLYLTSFTAFLMPVGFTIYGFLCSREDWMGCSSCGLGSG